MSEVFGNVFLLSRLEKGQNDMHAIQYRKTGKIHFVLQSWIHPQWRIRSK